MPYSAPLDGVRAIAILAVLVFHVSPAALRGGFTGVDVFFVLSGFLITSIILHDIREGSFSLAEFYKRRVQRLMPNIVATVLVTLVLWRVFLPPTAVVQAARHAIWTLLNLSNVFIWRTFGGYWGDSAASAPLLHTWSLAVEEQFYLLFPGSLVLLARFQRRRVFWWLVAAGVSSLALCIWGTSAHPVPTFYLLPTRVWELLLGAAMAAWRTPLVGEAPKNPWRNVPDAVGWVGVAVVTVGFFVLDETNGFPGAVALIPTVGTALILASIADGQGRLAKLLSTPFMVETGRLSYSLYLWHWPLITLGKMQADLMGAPPLAGAAVGLIASVVASWGAYVGIEQPLRSRGGGRGLRFAIIAAGFTLVTAGAGLLATGRAVPDFSAHFDKPTFHGLAYDAGKPGADVQDTIRYQDVYLAQPRAGAGDLWRSGGLVHSWGPGSPRVVVLGSSHALMYARLVDELCRELQVPVAFLAVNSTPAFFEATVNETFPTRREAQEFDAARLRWLEQWRPDVVLVIDRWDHQAAAGKPFEENLRSFLGQVSPLAGRVVVVTQVPVGTVGQVLNLRDYMAWRMGRGDASPKLLDDKNAPARERAAAAADQVAAEFPNLMVLHPEKAFRLPDGTVRWSDGRKVLYADSDHLTDAGAEVVRDLFRDALTPALSAPPANPRRKSTRSGGLAPAGVDSALVLDRR